MVRVLAVESGCGRAGAKAAGIAAQPETRATARKRVRDAKVNTSLTRSLRWERVQKDETDWSKCLMGWKEVRFELSHN